MKKYSQGPSLYFATDKNIFDALNQRKVDKETIMRLFEERNIVVSPKTPREELAKYFSRLTHDFNDHQKIADRLGIVSRRERVTSMEVEGIKDVDVLNYAIGLLKEEKESLGDVITVSRSGENISVNIQYTISDYSRFEFSQVQTRDGLIEFLKTTDGYTIRSTQNEYISQATESLLSKIEVSSEVELKRTVVSLFDVRDVSLRSRFFDRLTADIAGYKRIDVLALYFYNPRPDKKNDDSEDDDSVDTHIEKISLKGVGVSRSEMFGDVLKRGCYITRVVWTVAEVLSTGATYEIEAGFDDPLDCTEFSFILSGVYPVESGVVLKKKRSPLTSETEKISRVVDSHSRKVAAEIRAEFVAKA